MRQGKQLPEPLFALGAFVCPATIGDPAKRSLFLIPTMPYKLEIQTGSGDRQSDQFDNWRHLMKPY